MSMTVKMMRLFGAVCVTVGLANCGGGGSDSSGDRETSAGNATNEQANDRSDGTSSSPSSTSSAFGSGFAWHSLGEGMFGNVSAATIFNDELYVGGGFRSSGDVDLAGLAVWRNGAWHAAGEHFTVPFNAFLVHDGALYTGGHSANREEGYGLIRIGSDGTITRLGPALQDGAIEAIAEFKGDLIIAGGFINVGTNLSGSIARWDGQTYHALGDLGPNNAVYDLAVYRGDLYVAGWFQFHDSWSAEARPINYIARWDGEAWHPVGGGLNDSAYTLAVCHDMLYVGGDFSEAGETSANFIAAWDGANWRALGDGMDAPVHTLTAFDGDEGEAIIVGGQFMTAGGADHLCIAAWDGRAWHGLGAGLDDDVSVVYAITEGPLSPALIAGGDFFYAGDTEVSRVAIWRK